MLQLTLIRHAKSSWKDTTLKDFERPLNKRGRHNAPLMGRVIQDSGLSFDRMVSSPAERAITTARLIAAQLGYPEQQIQTLDEQELTWPHAYLGDEMKEPWSGPFGTSAVPLYLLLDGKGIVRAVSFRLRPLLPIIHGMAGGA